MEGVATTAYTGFKSYWRRKGYRRINQSGSRQQNNNFKRRRFRIPRAKLKLVQFRFRLGLGSVRGFFLKIRDGYVNAMLGCSKGMIYGGNGAMDGGFGGKEQVKEYDEKMLVEICKEMILTRQQRQRAIHGAAGVGGRRVASEVSPVSSVQ